MLLHSHALGSLRMRRLVNGWRTLLLLIALASAVLPTAAAADGGMLHNSLSVNGIDRSYGYFVSSKSNSFNGQWVVLALHDNGQSAADFAEQSGWVRVAEQGGFAVVFPQAINNTWSSNSGGEEAYIKAVFDHLRTNLISRYPGDNLPTVPTDTAPRSRNNPIWAWEPLRYLTGSGAGATVANEFAMNHPGLFAAVATLNGVAFDAAYARADEPAQAYFQYMRSKNVPPVWKQLKKEVPVTAWMFTGGAASMPQIKQADFWKNSAAVDSKASRRSIGGFETDIFQNRANAAQQFRLTQLADGARYDEAMARAIWSDLFAHIVRWTSSPNGDLTTVLTEAEVRQQFEVKSIDVGDGKPYTYYLKLPSRHPNLAAEGRKIPLVISAHGGNENAWLFTSKIKMHEVGEKEGFITVYPNGHRNTWKADDPDGPDARFIEQMIKDVVATYGADPTRVYMQGFSGGNILTNNLGQTRPQLFAAISPTNGPGPIREPAQRRVDEVKAKFDYRLPTMAIYGDVDSSTSVDGLITAGGSGLSALIQGGIDTLKKYNRIETRDQIERFNSPNTRAYDVLRLKGKRLRAGVDKRYPDGRFQIFQYMSSDPRPLNLLNVVMVTDMPHAYDLRTAQLQWDYFKHWSRNADGSLTYSE